MALLLAEDADVWLLTEVSERLTLPGYFSHATRGNMAHREVVGVVGWRLGFRDAWFIPDLAGRSGAEIAFYGEFCTGDSPSGAPETHGVVARRRRLTPDA